MPWEALPTERTPSGPWEHPQGRVRLKLVRS